MKKSILLLSISIITLYSCHQKAMDSYTISGDIPDLKDPYIYFQYMNGDSMRVDSSTVTSGKFNFKGKVAEPEMAAIYLKDFKGSIQFFLENADIHITGKADSMNNAKVTGSNSQGEFESYQAFVKSITDEEDSLYKQYDAAKKNNDSATVATLQNQIDGLGKQRDEQTKTFIANHPKSFVSLYQLDGLTYSTPYAELNKLFTGLDTSLQNSANGKKMVSQLAIMEKTSIGKQALLFIQNDVNGKPVSLSDYKGKYVLVDFWASWCGPCRAENPNVLKAFNQYKNKNFTVLGVSLDEKDTAWEKAVKEDGLPWTQVSDLKGWKNEAAQEYGVNAIPANYLLDPNGIIIAHNLRGDALENKLAEVLK